MTVALQVFLLVGGLAVALYASEHAVKNTRALAARLGAPAFVVGVTLVSIGTDLPEIANSIAAHLQGEGDVNVGDSIGSALTQYTLVLGLFPLVARTLFVNRRQVGTVSVLTIAGLGMTSVFVANGWLSRWEGGALVLAWALFTWILVRGAPGLLPEEAPLEMSRGPHVQAATILLSLAFVGFGATVAVRALVRLAQVVGVPEFVIAFFGASLGTSAPELAVDLTALARGLPALALGDALGSSLVDSTLSVGAGALVAPAAVTRGLALSGALYTIFAVAVVGLVLSLRRRHDRVTGTIFIGLYAIAYAVLIESS